MRIRGLEKNEARWTIRWAYGVMKRQFGKVLTPYTVMAHHPRAAFTSLLMNGTFMSWKDLQFSLKGIVCVRVAQLIGCPF